MALVLVLQVLSFGPDPGRWWGVHFVAFLPLPGAALLMLGSVATLAWALRSGRAPSAPTGWTAAAGLTVGFGVLTWVFRSQQTVLGDAWPLMLDLPQGQDFHPRQPLTLWIQQQWFGLVTTLADGEPRELARRSVALGSVVCGIGFVPVAWGLGRALVARREHAPWATLALLGSGYAVLFFGYVENYAWPLLANAALLWAGLTALRRPFPLAPAFVLFALGLGLHLSTILLLPAVVFLGVVVGRDASRRRGLVMDLVIGCLALGLLDLWMRSRGLPLATAIGDLLGVAAQDNGGGRGLAYLLSVRHLRDFLNEALLVGPFAVGLASVGIGFLVRSRDAAHWFLGLASTALLGAAFLTTEPLLGYARDWDLFAPAAVVWMAFGVTAVVATPQAGRLLAGVALVSTLHLGTWVAFNHSEPLAMERFATLPLGLGRTEVVMGNWHLRQGRPDDAEDWFRRAIRTNPSNANAWGLLGNLYARQDRFDDGAQAYAEALRTRPDKTPFRSSLVRCLVELGRWEEAVPHLEIMVQQDPGNLGFWRGLAQVHRELGHEEDYRRCVQEAARLFEARMAASPEDPQLPLDHGAMLANAGEFEPALRLFQRALDLDPESDAALFNAGAVLVKLHRTEEAIPYLARLLQLYPDHPQREMAERWLARAHQP